ncbi:MAG: vanadium-dependent haloperoxidase [Saprospiraceae bacterium]
MRNFVTLFSAFMLISLVVTSCKKDITETDSKSAPVSSYDNTLVHEWNDLFLTVERYAPGYAPCPAANAVGYIGFANYEAVVSGMPDFKSLATRYSGLSIPSTLENQEYHWPSVINAVNNYIYLRLFPEVDAKYTDAIKTLYNKYEQEYSKEVSSEVYLRSKLHGEAVAKAVWDWFKTDSYTFEGYKKVFDGYNWQDRANEPGAWTPTLPGPTDGKYPLWGKGRPFAITEDQKLCKPYTSYAKYSEDPTSAFYSAAVTVVDKNKNGLSYVDQSIAEFWSDDNPNLTFSPPARWLAIADQIYVNENVNLETAIYANAKVGLALHDAAIGAWNSKYYYNLVRPVTYINKLMNATWETNLSNPTTGIKSITPAFPSYPSGHATFSASAAEVLSDIFGYAYSMTDNCHKDRTEFIGTPRSFNNLYEMAEENAYSRVPLGVHFDFDSVEGRQYGQRIGQVVNKLPWKK